MEHERRVRPCVHLRANNMHSFRFTTQWSCNILCYLPGKSCHQSIYKPASFIFRHAYNTEVVFLVGHRKATLKVLYEYKWMDKVLYTRRKKVAYICWRGVLVETTIMGNRTYIMMKDSRCRHEDTKVCQQQSRNIQLKHIRFSVHAWWQLQKNRTQMEVISWLTAVDRTVAWAAI